MSNFFDRERRANLVESGHGPYGQIAAVRRHIFTLDEPEVLGGNDTGPDPIEMLAASLAACTAMTLRMYAQRRKLPLEKIKVDVSHKWVRSESGETQDRFTRIIEIEPSPSEDLIEKLRDIADRCPVHRALTGASQFDTVWQ